MIVKDDFDISPAAQAQMVIGAGGGKTLYTKSEFVLTRLDEIGATLEEIVLEVCKDGTVVAFFTASDILRHLTFFCHRMLRNVLQNILNQYTEVRFNALTKAAAASIHDIARSIEAKFIDPKSESRSDIAHKITRKQDPSGLFYFKTYSNGRIKSGAASKSLPEMKVVPKEEFTHLEWKLDCVV